MQALEAENAQLLQRLMKQLELQAELMDSERLHEEERLAAIRQDSTKVQSEAALSELARSEVQSEAQPKAQPKAQPEPSPSEEQSAAPSAVEAVDDGADTGDKQAVESATNE